ncbi:MAG: FeoB-associated Cys-rich membrane protein [Lachnospiraceae bacterium]|jgi:hypothetical protein|nr:FeoB-associated Cys-rich membrane protein [Lachnospiraceae bacterium]
MEQITEILPSVIAGGILAIIIVLIIMSRIRERKHGGCSCGCPGCTGSCPHCSAAGTEHKEEN